MLYLLIAVFAGSCKGFCGKKISGSVTGIYDSIAMSVIRMFFCCVIGFSVAAMQGGSFSITPVKGGIYLLSGISMAVFLISWLLAVRGGAFMLINAFTTASFLVTTIFGFAVFKERITLKQIVGMLFIVAAIILLIKYNNRIKAKMSVKDFLMLLVVLVSQGLTNVSQKMFTAWVPDGSNAVFNFYTFLITFVLLAVWFACMSVKNAGPQFKLKSTVGYIAVMAVMLFLNSYFLTAATKHMPSVVLYPLSSVLSLTAATVMAAVFFKEKITKTSAAGILCTFVSVMLTK